MAALAGLTTACKDGATDLGMRVQGNGDLTAALLVDTFTVTSYTVKPDQGNFSSDNGQLVLSWRKDPENRTGELFSEGYFEVRMPDAKAVAPRLPVPPETTPNPVFTITLPFQVVDREVADSMVDAHFVLYELDEQYNPNTIYFTSDQRRLRQEAGTELVLDSQVIIHVDTVGRKTASLRKVTFNVGGDIAQRIYQYVTTNGWDADDLKFTGQIPGFAVRMKVFKAGTQIPVVMSLGIGANSSARFTYVQAVKTPPRGIFQRDTNVHDTVAMQLNIDCRHHTFVNANRQTSEIANLVQDPSGFGWTPANGSRRTYVQGGQPLWAYLRFPGLTDFLQKEKNIVLLRAELAMVNDNQDGPLPKPPASLLGFRGVPDPLQLTRNNYNTSGILNEDIQNSAINFFYDSASARYPVNITPVLQGIVNGKEPNLGVTMAVPISNYNFRTFTFHTSTDTTDKKRTILKVYFVRTNGGK